MAQLLCVYLSARIDTPDNNAGQVLEPENSSSPEVEANDREQ